jgi:hypothetical protein
MSGSSRTQKTSKSISSKFPNFSPPKIFCLRDFESLSQEDLYEKLKGRDYYKVEEIEAPKPIHEFEAPNKDNRMVDMIEQRKAEMLEKYVKEGSGENQDMQDMINENLEI